MEPITPYALVVEPAGYGVMIRHFVMIAMKCSVEACDLRQRRKFGKKRTDRRQIVGLMKRRKRRKPLQTRNYAVVNHHGSVVIRTAMDDPMSDSEWAELKFISQPCACDQHCSWNVWNALDRIGTVGQRIAIRSGGAQAWTASNAVHLALDFASQPPVPVQREHLELHA